MTTSAERRLSEWRDSGELINQAWPKDGPHSTEALLSAGDALRELVRYLNYSTQRSTTTLPYASFGYSLTGELAGTAGLQPQLYHQLGRWAASLADLPELRDAEQREAGQPAAAQKARAASDAFAKAAALADELELVLSQAHSALSPLEHEEEA